MRLTVRMTHISVALLCCVGAVACSSDDSPDTSGDAVSDTSTPGRAPDPDPTPGTADTPASENADIELLAAVLLTPEAVGVPDTWAIRDLDPGVPAEQLDSDDVDLAFGVVDCELGPPATGSDGLWLRRRFAAPDEPLDNGLLAVEVVAEVQDDDALARRLGDIESCLGESSAFVDAELQRRAEPGVEGAIITIGAAPSERVAFPSRHAIAVAHADQRTVTVVFSGIDQDRNWDTDAVELADRILTLLDG